MEVVSLAEAARLTKKSRNTLKTHLKLGKLSGSQNDNGDWEIQVSELIRVYKDLPGTNREEQGNDGPEVQSRPSRDGGGELIAENAVLKERLELTTRKHTDEKHLLQEQIEFLKEQIDKKDSQMLTMNAQLEDHRERRAKTEDRAEEREKEKSAELAKYQAALKQARESLKEQRSKHRRELEEARRSRGWLGLLKSLVGAEGNRKRVGEPPRAAAQESSR